MLLFVVRKSFYIYCFLLAVLNVLQSVGCAMLGFAYISAGWWYVDCLIHYILLFYWHLKVPEFTASYVHTYTLTFVRPHKEKVVIVLSLGRSWDLFKFSYLLLVTLQATRL